MASLAVGQRVRLADGREATIRFAGQAAFAAGDWLGVELDSSTGKNDGSVQGERYFDCPMGYGMFLRPSTVTVIAPLSPPPRPAVVRKTSRPSSMFTSGSARGAGAGPGPGSTSSETKRMSLNAPSPSPVPRGPRPSSLVRSPTKSPTKQLATASSSAAPSRTGTPSNAKAPLGVKPRTSVGPPRAPMGPPAIPASRTRQPSTSSASASASRTAPAPPRSLSGRPQPITRPAPFRSGSGRNMSSSSQSGLESSSNGVTGNRGTDSPRKSSDDEIISPLPTSPVQARTMALEKLSVKSPPGPSRPAAASAPPPRPTAATTSAMHKEVEDLKAKLRVLEKKRMEDREKLNNLEKVKGERDKFERIIQTLQIKYQPQTQEIADLKRHLKEAETRLYSVEEIQAEHESALELATLDREMAEETAEVLKAELDALKQKSEELELEVEILREENAEFTLGMSPEERSSQGWLQMERSNERYREALIRLRDLSHQQEEELRDQIKGLEQDLSEFETVKEQHAVTKEKLAQSEAAVEDLREQLNDALGAEDLIESLTEQTMNQSEEIKELKAVIDDLESLKEINDELEINHVQNEKEMQEELDLKDAMIIEQARQAAAQKENYDDMEYTVSRFRELVVNLQSDLEDMRASHAVTENESEQLNSRSRAMMDLNLKLQVSASKTQVKTIDLELQRMEAQEAEQHLEIVKLFLPDSYQTDKDSVLALLRFKRLAFKANLLNNFIKDRVNGQPHPGHEDDVFEGCDAIDKLTWVSAMCERFVNGISHCSLGEFAKYEGALYELEPVERALNGWIDGLRRDELKEKQCATELQRTIALMTHLGEVHISNDLESFADDVHMRALLMQSRLESAAVSFTATKGMVQRIVPSEAEEEELAQYFLKKAEAVVSQTRSAKVIAGKAVRALEDLKTRSLSLMPETLDAFESCEVATQELANMARSIGLELHRLLHEEGRTEPYTYAEVQSWVQNIAHTTFNSSESDLFSTYLNRLRIVTSQISDIAAVSTDLTQTQEFDRSAAPWILRAQELKALKTVPVDAEEELRRLKDDINDARRAIAVREESLSTAQVKIETLESRMRDANAKTSRIVDLEVQIELAKQQAASLRDDIEKQDRELKVLEADRDKWKKIASDSRLVMGNGTDAGRGEAGSKARQERAVATAREMNALQAEIAGLQSAVRYLREDSRRARMTEQSSYDWLAEPLTKPVPVAEQRRAMVVAEGKVVLGELVKLATSAKVYDLGSLPKDKLAWKPARSTPQYHAAKQMEDFEAWKSWQGAVLKKSRVLVAHSPGVMNTAASSSGRAGGGDAVGKTRNKAVARLQIRLPGAENVKRESAREVQIVGSREWEGLQGSRRVSSVVL
ncbi:dynein associated protein-domain-containing protein [Podospora appendiculata]|uniref:Dynein associated protein-domain-containing protein n=1 Tax=Podospora appendiculata TaxID=314037 RepID=A0AAE0X397_9PEZI|nr:dynein associated protein-domain-containing protein [Podospora appendiculata]